MILSAGADRRAKDILEAIPDEMRERVFALPYRVGMYISQSDSAGGDDAHLREFEALVNIITGFSEDFLKSELMQKILQETVLRKDRWRQWNADLSDVLEDCVHVMEALAQAVEHPRDLQSVRETLIDIAIAVAMAFQEGDHDGGASSGLGGLFLPLRRSLGKVLPSLAVDERFAHLSISRAERDALHKIVKALNY